ncbi:MAG: Fe-S protein assembly co-chaperone HscB [Gammaproteobacteria bacterium]|uniref:Co-chaperone protein HscB homolog n=1 Tax=endosymbiont of Bathymodiolus septemdierum str. Myojin knoll TaxID=1303921 RepID=A0A0P0USF5_9GAMM|nr:Fe-S protein assembly co-chaperone HscB [Bathymodiolus septemdierum thioautotrophic gill symbiont]RUA04904.1 MAG: Fe-S protein assembly co-chaperone HscB [Gammaproteobacteria bacterium]BAS67912.1 molecular chaperone HscB [endosymbiont of Bathymodiolus septemdierum str. Myojin knoll]
MQNYFELFSLEVGFDLDVNALEGAYLAKISEHHPDKFVTKSDKEQSIALQNTSLINTAFNTLKSPLLRATYLLELQNINAFDEKDTQMDMDFLMSQIALRESLEDIEKSKDVLQLDDFTEDIDSKVRENICQIQSSFKNNNINKIKNLVRELKFYTQLNAQANRLMDEWL